MKKSFAVLAAAMAVLTAVAWGAGNVPDEVKGIFQKRCAGCHKGNHPSKGLNLEPAKVAAILDAPSKQVPGLKIVDTTSPDSSYLLKKVRRENDVAGRPMPPGKALTAGELQVIETWIAGLKQSPVSDEYPSSPGGEFPHRL